MKVYQGTRQGTTGHSRLSQLVEPPWTDPGLKSGIGVRELISTLKKNSSGGERIVQSSFKIVQSSYKIVQSSHKIVQSSFKIVQHEEKATTKLYLQRDIQRTKGHYAEDDDDDDYINDDNIAYFDITAMDSCPFFECFFTPIPAMSTEPRLQG